MTKATAAKKPVPQDWHPADVIATLRKAEWSLQQLAFANGYTSRTTLAKALHQPYPRAEAMIAAALGLEPWDIWPSRYGSDHKPNRPKGLQPRRPAHLKLVNGKPTTAHGTRNPQSSSAS